MLIFEFMLNGKIIFCVLLFGFATMQIFGQVKVLQGKVVKVIDGDTFDLLTNEDVLFRVRMAHIDAPEKKQDFGSVSKKILLEKIVFKVVSVSFSTRDRNGRILGTVFYKNRNINLQMVEEGMAWHFTKFSSDENYANAQKSAQTKKLGIWSKSVVISPWEFRKSRKK